MRDLKLKKGKFSYAYENDMAMICEIGYYLGQNEILDSEIKDLIGKCYSNDGYVVFYTFCKFIYEQYNTIECSINYGNVYDFIDDEGVELFERFKIRYFEEEK